MTETVEPESERNQTVGMTGWKGPYALRALAHRNFALLWTGQLISLTGTWMQSLALPWVTYTQLTQNKILLGLVAAASMIPSIFITLPSGVIADRFSKRKIVIYTQTLLMLQALILAALTFSGHLQLWHVIFLALFAGSANAMDMPTRQSMVIELVGKDYLVNAVALNSSIFNLTRIIGPSIAGIVLARYGSGWCFLLNGISYVAALIGLLLMKNLKIPKRASNSESMCIQIWEGFIHVWQNVLTRNMLIMTAISTIFIAQYTIFMPVFAKDIYKVGAAGQGVMVSVIGLGALLAAGAVASLGHRVKQTTIVFFGALLAPGALFALSFSQSYQFTLVCLTITGFGMMMFWAVSNTIMQIGAPAGLVGRVMSIRALVLFGLGVVGSLSMGALAQRVGVPRTVTIGAAITLLSSIYFVLASRSAAGSPNSPASLTPDEARVSID